MPSKTDFNRDAGFSLEYPGRLKEQEMVGSDEGGGARWWSKVSSGPGPPYRVTCWRDLCIIAGVENPFLCDSNLLGCLTTAGPEQLQDGERLWQG